MPVENVILTHSDLDGMVCGILLLTSLPADETAIRITNGTHLRRELRQLVDSQPQPSQVLIADIPLLSGNRTEVLTALRDLKALGVHVSIYDHHFGWDRAPEAALLCCTYCVDTRKTTAAALVWRERLRGDTASQQRLRLLSEKAASEAPEHPRALRSAGGSHAASALSADRSRALADRAEDRYPPDAQFFSRLQPARQLSRRSWR